MANLLRPSDLVLSVACVVAIGLGSAGVAQLAQQAGSDHVTVATTEGEGPQDAVPSVPPLDPVVSVSQT